MKSHRLLSHPPRKKIIGSWELISVNGKTPEEDMQQDVEDEELEFLEVDQTRIFASDGSFFRKLLIGMGLPISPGYPS